MNLGILILETGGGNLAEISWCEPFLIYLVAFVIIIGVIFAVKEMGSNTGCPVIFLETGSDAKIPP